MNQTNVLILFGQPLQDEFYWEYHEEYCIIAIQFSFEQLSWHSINNCILNVGERNPVIYNELDEMRDSFHPNILNIQCQSIFEKDANM